MEIKVHSVMKNLVGEFSFEDKPLYLEDIQVGDTFVLPVTTNPNTTPDDPKLVRTEVIVGKNILPGPNENFNELELMTVFGNKIRMSIIMVGDYRYRINGKSVMKDADGNRYIFPLYTSTKNISESNLMAYWFRSDYDDAPEGFQIVCMEEDLSSDFNTEGI